MRYVSCVECVRGRGGNESKCKHLDKTRPQSRLVEPPSAHRKPNGTAGPSSQAENTDLPFSPSTDQIARRPHARPHSKVRATCLITRDFCCSRLASESNTNPCEQAGRTDLRVRAGRRGRCNQGSGWVNRANGGVGMSGGAAISIAGWAGVAGWVGARWWWQWCGGR